MLRRRGLGTDTERDSDRGPPLKSVCNTPVQAGGDVSSSGDVDGDWREQSPLGILGCFYQKKGEWLQDGQTAKASNETAQGICSQRRYLPGLLLKGYTVYPE